MKKVVAGIVAAGLVGLVAAWAADEITVNVYLDVENGTYKSTKQVAGFKCTQATSAMDGSVMNVTSATNAINLDHITSGGYTWFRNVSGTGSVFVARGSPGNATGFLEIPTGKVCLVYLAGTNYCAWTTLAACTSKLDTVSHER